jgi:hypothetical protein
MKTGAPTVTRRSPKIHVAAEVTRRNDGKAGAARRTPRRCRAPWRHHNSRQRPGVRRAAPPSKSTTVCSPRYLLGSYEPLNRYALAGVSADQRFSLLPPRLVANNGTVTRSVRIFKLRLPAAYRRASGTICCLHRARHDRLGRQCAHDRRPGSSRHRESC